MYPQLTFRTIQVKSDSDHTLALTTFLCISRTLHLLRFMKFILI